MSDVDDLPEEVGEPEATSPRRLRGWMVTVAVLVALAAVAGAVWTGLDVRAQQHDDDADAAALSAGRTAAVAFTSYDYTSLDEDLQKVTDLATGSFRTQFTSALGALTQAIREAEGVSVGTVAYAGLEQRSGDTAVVIAAVDATITNASSARPSTRRYRLQITLNRTSGPWLIAKIAPVT